MSNADGYVVIGTELDLSGIEKNLERMTQLMESRGERAAKNTADKMARKFALNLSVLSNVMGKVINVIESSLSGAVSRVDILENFPRIMQSLGISSEDAAESIDYLSEKLIGIPTTLDEGVKAVQRFTSANRNVKASTEMYLALNNALLAGGTGPEQQAIAMEQMSQAYAKGKMDYKEWLAIMQTAPAQMRQVAEIMGHSNMEEFGKALREGTISMNDFMTTLVKMNHESVNGFKTLDEQAREGTRGIKTAITNMKTTIVRAVGEAMQAIGQANIANFFQTITDTIKALLPYIAAFVRSFMVAVSTIASFIGKIKKAIGSLFGKKEQKDTKETSFSYDAVSSSIGAIGTSADKATGSAQKLKKELKQLAGFDEMNVLQDNSTSGGGASGGSGDVLGDIEDLGDLANIDLGLDKINEKMVELGKIAKIVAAAIWGIIAAWAAWKISKLLADIGLLNHALTLTQSTGIALFVAGTIVAISAIVDLAKNWDKLTTAQKIAIGSAATLAAGIAGLGVALTLGLSGPIGFLVGALVGLVAVIGTAIWKTNQYKDSTYQLKTAKERLKETQEKLKDSMKTYADAIDAAEAADVKLKEAEEKHNLVGKDLYQSVLDGTLSYEKMNGAQREVYKAYLDNVNAQKLAREERDKNNKLLAEEKTKIDGVSGAYIVNKGKMDENFQKLYENWKTGKIEGEDFRNHIFNMLNELDKSHRETFVENLPEDIKQAFGPDSKGREHIMAFDDGTQLAYKDIREASQKTKDKVKKDTEDAFGGDSIRKTKDFQKATEHSFNEIASTSSSKMKSVKGDINSALDKNNYQTKGNLLKNWWNGLINGLTSSFSISFGLNGVSIGKKAAKGAIVTYPKLAAGGIINLPGRGVPVGGAVGGERGAEGVIPLTDSQQMEKLGEAIGKYITVNNVLNNYMNSRLISREIKKSDNESDFAFNG